MDEIDRAAELEMAERENALRHILRDRPTGVSLPDCCECEAPIPVARQRAVPGVRRCIECQIVHEKQMAGHGRR
ncbi:TraR/DksA C4-type zinc finger protein [Alcaligenaceae bacterium]|nr:TraR/DksA C4-type zinc finger protein [Alcaligenaceae bacterium]